MERLAHGFDFLEGPRYAPDGSLYFTDGTGIRRLDPNGTVETILDGRGAGGVALHADGGVVVSGPELVHLIDGRVDVLFDPGPGENINDIYTDERGRLYAGTWIANPDAPGDIHQTIPGQCWRVSERGAGDAIYGNVGFPNGIGFSPDGGTIYQSDSFRRQIIVHTIDDEGRASPSARIDTSEVPGVPDGLAVDVDGCLWLGFFEGGCVARLTPEGKVDQTIEMPAHRVTSLCFGGADLLDMYIVTCDNPSEPGAKGGIYLRRSDVAGLPTLVARV